MMMFFADVAFLLAILSFGTCNVHAPFKPKHNKVVTCYVASWAVYRPDDGAFTLQNLRSEFCTHLIYAFAGLDRSNWTIKSLDPWNDIQKDGIGNYKRMTALRKKDLKVLLGIGGWNEGSGNYSIMASSPDRRKTFIDSAVKFLKTYEFDGLDLDWEFPGKRGGSPNDKQNFVSLVKELKDAFKSHLLLTAAISAVKDTIDVAYDIPEISKYLDYIHVMAYDYHGLWDGKVLPNSPLRSKDGLSVEDTVTYLLQQGVPTKKLVLGLAMYGRTFVLTKVPEPNVNPIGLASLKTAFKGPYTSEEGFMGFNEICESLSRSQNWTNGWDNYSSTAYAIKTDHIVVYDNVEAIIAKVEYVKKKDLAGVMIWSIDMDDFLGNCKSLHNEDNYPLMRVINATLHKTNMGSNAGDERTGSSSGSTKNVCIFSTPISALSLQKFISRLTCVRNIHLFWALTRFEVSHFVIYLKSNKDRRLKIVLFYISRKTHTQVAEFVNHVDRLTDLTNAISQFHEVLRFATDIERH